MKKLLVGAGAIVLASVGWLVWPRGAEPSPPTVLDGDVPVVLVAGSQSALPLPVDAPAAPARTAVAPPIVATTGALRVVCVWKEDGAPADSASVHWHRLDPTEARVSRHTARVDAAGFAVVPNLEPGRYRASAGAGRTEHPAEADVRAGERAELRFELEPELVLEGVVVDVDARPVGAAAVRALDPRTGDVRTFVTTDTKGAFRWRGPRLWQVWAEKAMCQPSAFASLPSGDGQTHRVRLQLGGSGCAIAGIVLRPDGSPAGDALVAITVDERTRETLLPDGSVDGRRPPLVLRADGSGRFATASVPVGRHTVLARTPGFAAARIEIDVTDAPGELIILRLTKGAIVRGTLRDELGHPLAIGGSGVASASPKYTVIGLDPASPPLLHTRVTLDGDPTYELRGVQPGTMWLNAQQGMRVVRREVELTDGQELTWDPVLGGGPSIAGRVVDPDDKPLGRWEVMGVALSSGAGFDRRSLGPLVTDAEGRFTFEGVADCEHRLIAVAPRASGAAALMPWAVEPKVRAGAGDVVLRVRASLDDAGSITGEVLGPDGKAMLDARVIVTPAVGFAGYQPTERPDAATGRFAIGPLPPDEYRITVSVEGKGSISLDPRSLAPRQKLDLGTIRFAAPGTATVAFAPDGAAPGADLDLVLRGAGGYGRDFFTLDDGARRSVPVLPGSYTLEVWGSGFAPISQQVEIAPGADTRTTVTLQPAADVTIEVVPEAPSAIAFLLVDLRLEDSASNAIYRRLTQVHRKGDVYSWTRGLPPGDYRVTARRLAPFADGEARFTVPAGATPLTVRVALAPSGR